MEPQDIIDRKEGLDIAFAEARKIKMAIIHLISGKDRYLPKYEMEIRENEFHICDVIYNRCTLLVQYYTKYSDTARGAYVVFVLVKGLFDRKGRADLEYPPFSQEQNRYTISFDDLGNFGWSNKDGEFSLSEPLGEKWVRQFVDFAKQYNNDEG